MDPQKLVIVILMIGLPFAGFLFGIHYQKSLQYRSVLDSPINALSPSVKPSAPLVSYVNKQRGFFFQHTPAEVVSGGKIFDKTDNDILLMSIHTTTPPTQRNYKDEKEAIQEIFDYWASSTSQYLSPELHKISGPMLSSIMREDSQLVPLYRYEIGWYNDPPYGDGARGTDVWLFIPISKGGQSTDPNSLEWLEENYSFLWLRYDKKYENRLLPILNSFTLDT